MSNTDSRSKTARYRDGAAVGYLLNRTAHIVAATFSEELRNDAITLPVWRALTALMHTDKQSLSELATHVGAELSYLSRLVSGAEEQGLMKRLVSDTDKRSTRVAISAKGRAMFRKFAPRAEALESLYLAGIPADDVETLRRALRMIYANILASQEHTNGTGRKLQVARRVNERSLSEAKAG
jgi:DNA-binding MarR family transcriptional regulator